MGIASVFKLVDANLTLVQEHDFDKALDTGLRQIADSLPADHTFRRLLDVLEGGSADENLHERFESLVGEEDGEMGFVIVPWDQLNEFEAYARGDIAQQWNDLFPGKKPGILNWIKYHTRLKAVEKAYKAKPTAPFEEWYRDTYAELLEIVKRAIEEKCFILREHY